MEKDARIAELEAQLKEARFALEDIIQQECSVTEEHEYSIKIGDLWFHNMGLSCYENAFEYLKNHEPRGDE